MDIWMSFGGMVQYALTSADPAQAITQINQAGICIYDVNREDDDIVTRISVRRQDAKKLAALAQKRGYDLRLCRRTGIYWIGKRLLKRPILTIGILLFLVVAMYLPTRVLFVSVEGNATIPTRYILEKSQQCGISFGVSRKEVRSEKMKNALLEAIPQLQWAGINTSGCTAIISVRERTPAPELQMDATVSSIVAKRDGVITECTVVRGNPVCKVGQAVKAGEMLISGYTDCGIVIQATKAEGEVYAATNRSLEMILPLNWQTKGAKTATEQKYSVIIGKKRINFYKGSGISGTSCDKMYEERYIVLPGGFRLPIKVVTETWIYCEEQALLLSQPQLSDYAQQYLLEQMVAGKILSSAENETMDDGLYRFQGNYACTEMIGQVRSEETVKPNE